MARALLEERGEKFWWERAKVTWNGTLFDQMILKPNDPDALPAMQRIAKLREECVQAYKDGKTKLTTVMAKIITESYKQTEGEHLAIRRALAMREVFRKIPIPLSKYQLLAGTYASELGVEEFNPELTGPGARHAFLADIQKKNERLSGLDTASLSTGTFVTKEDEKIFQEEIYPYWEGRTFGAHRLREMKRNYPETYQYYENSNWLPPIRGGGGSLYHTIQDYIFVARKGLEGIKEEIRKHITELDPAHPTGLEEFERRNLYEAMIIAAEGMIEYANRCADQAEELSKTEKDPERARELAKIAEICRKVPAKPAETWWEALQSVHFLHMGQVLVEQDDSNSYGNFDQYMYPLLKNDLEDGTITLKEAQELLECFYCKHVEARVGMSGRGRQGNTRITIGGQDAAGRDQTNLLTRMCLEAQTHVHLHNPCLTFRIHRNTSDEYLRMALEVVRTGGGFPYLCSDEAIITGLLAMGIPLAEARNWADCGCQEVLLDPNMVPGVDSNGRTNTGFSNGVAPIELALWNGVNPFNGKQAGPKTGDPRTFKTFDEFKEAVRKQLECAIKHNVIVNNVNEALHPMFHPHVFHDLMHPGPRNTGIDIDAGGCVYNWAGNLNVGTANMGDIMTAIDYLIYEKKEVTWDQMLDALKNNWEGYEELRQKCINAPKYGAADPYADDHTNEILQMFFDIWESFNVTRKFGPSTNDRGPFICGLISMDTHMRHGEVTGATPDGRKAGEYLAAACSPSQYAPALGPTATHISAARAIDTAHTVNGVIFNQKFSPTAVISDREVSKWMDLVKTYVEMGGQQVNYNIVARETLLEAQKNPEKYMDLWVRVGGYSARFVDLSKELQDEIIARTEQSL